MRVKYFNQQSHNPPGNMIRPFPFFRVSNFNEFFIFLYTQFCDRNQLFQCLCYFCYVIDSLIFVFRLHFFTFVIIKQSKAKTIQTIICISIVSSCLVEFHLRRNGELCMVYCDLLLLLFFDKAKGEHNRTY